MQQPHQGVAVQYYKLDGLLQAEQEKFDSMPEKLSKVSVALEKAAAKVNQIDREYEDQVGLIQHRWYKTPALSATTTAKTTGDMQCH